MCYASHKFDVLRPICLHFASLPSWSIVNFVVTKQSLRLTLIFSTSESQFDRPLEAQEGEVADPRSVSRGTQLRHCRERLRGLGPLSIRAALGEDALRVIGSRSFHNLREENDEDWDGLGSTNRVRWHVFTELTESSSHAEMISQIWNESLFWSPVCVLLRLTRGDSDTASFYCNGLMSPVKIARKEKESERSNRMDRNPSD